MAIMREGYRTPFDWNGLVTWLGARAIPGLEAIDNNTYMRAGVRVWHEDGAVHTTAEPERVRRVFGLDADPAAIHAVLGRDRMLGPLLRKRPGVRVPGAWDPFELAVRAIVGQQLSVAGRVRSSDASPRAHAHTQRLAEVTVEGMPRKRAETIRTLAREVVSGAIVLGESDLTQLPASAPGRPTTSPAPWRRRCVSGGRSRVAAQGRRSHRARVTPTCRAMAAVSCLRSHVAVDGLIAGTSHAFALDAVSA